MTEPDLTSRKLVVLATSVRAPARPEDETPLNVRVHVAVDGLSLPGAKSIELRQLDTEGMPDISPSGSIPHLPMNPRYELHAVFDVDTRTDDLRGNWCTAYAVPADDLRSVFADILEIHGLTEIGEDLPGALVGAVNDYLTGRFASTQKPYYRP